MGFNEIMELVQSEYVFAVLFIFGLYAVVKWAVEFIQSVRDENATREDQLHGLYEKSLEDATNREEYLKEHLDKTTGQLERITHTQVRIQDSLDKLEKRVDESFTEVWKELGGKANKNN